MSDLWVFGYGSLMWNPGFDFVESVSARLHGAHRSLCIYSWVHRGSRERPGLVLGLDRGGSCRGIAFRVAAGDRQACLGYLRARELVTAVYREVSRHAVTEHGQALAVMTFIADRGHPQYAGRLPFARQLDLVRGGVGGSGRNVDYVLNTARHLREIGIVDAPLERLAAAL